MSVQVDKNHERNDLTQPIELDLQFCRKQTCPLYTFPDTKDCEGLDASFKLKHITQKIFMDYHGHMYTIVTIVPQLKTT